jgi:hypothetical protein
MTFNAQDIVRIVKQPPNEHVSLVGQVGFIDEISEHWCSLHAVNLDGSSSGLGTIPLDCLQAEPDPKWREACDRYRAYIDKLGAGMREYAKRHDALVHELAVKHGISTSAVLAIHDALSSLEAM